MPRTDGGRPRLALCALPYGPGGTGRAGEAGGASPRERAAPARSRIVVTMGDPAGVGPEIVLKALAARGRGPGPELTVVGVGSVLDDWAGRLGLGAPHSVVDVGGEGIESEPGRPTEAGARWAVRAIVEAARLCVAGEADAMVTAPVSKSAIAHAGYDFCGHTEFLAELTGADRYLMTFVSGARRVGLVTTHLPIAEVPRVLSTELILEKLRVLDRGLAECFRVGDPRIAVAGLNPHAGESGRIGDEDATIVRPAVEAARGAGIDAEGPFPADTIYCGLGEPEGAGRGAGYDAVLAMYHDQATIAVKLWGLAAGVNVTLGLPIIRTSVDHGTAFDIAGRGVANPGSLISAIDLAVEIVAARRAWRGRAAGGESP
jgi:4-hydroxythreonine-4-phosphate dehydrogenase